MSFPYKTTNYRWFSLVATIWLFLVTLQVERNKQDAVSSAVKNCEIGYLSRLLQGTLDVLEQGIDGNRVTG